MHRPDRPAGPRRLCLALTVLLVTACAPSTGAVTRTHDARAVASAQPSRATSGAQGDALSGLPDEARVATRQGDPRTVAYWAVWNTCAPDNRADVAAANGGRDAGWILLDDLIADPGIQLGGYRISTCDEALALLKGHSVAGQQGGDPIYALAGALLAAELNLNAGAETCPIAEEAVLGAHLVLAEVGFDGTRRVTMAASGEIAEAVPRLAELLSGYNRGELCR